MKSWFGWAGLGLGLVIAIGAAVTVKLRAERAVVIVNGEKIARGQFIAEMERQHGATVLRRMIQERLILQAAQKKGLVPTSAQIEKEIADMRELEPDMDRQLRINGKTMADLQEDLRGRMSAANLIAAEVKLPDEEVKKLYKENLKRFSRPEGRKIAMVLAKSKDIGEKARRLVSDGIPTEFASQNAGMALPGGRSQLVIYRGQLPPDFEKQIFAMKTGEISSVLSLGTAFAVVKVLETVPARQRSFEEVKEKLVVAAKLRKGKSQPELLQALQKSAKLEIKSDRYKGLEDTALPAADPRAGKQVAQTGQ
jgi:parvulin-like peptidyl-prolyl isomerase